MMVNNIQVWVWVGALLLCCYIFYLIKFKRSERIFKICSYLQKKKTDSDNKRDKEKFISKIYKRNSSERFSSIFYVIILLLVAFIVFNQYVNFIVVTSESMSPTVNRGDIVLVQSIFKTPAVGDIVQFDSPGSRLPVFHRVFSLTSIGYITKGDASAVQDRVPVRDSQLQARAITILDKPIIVRDVGELFIVESKTTKYGSDLAFTTGLVGIFKTLALIIFVLSLLALISRDT